MTAETAPDIIFIGGGIAGISAAARLAPHRPGLRVHIAGDGVRRHAMGFGLGNGDYSERLVLSQHARITEKLVRAQHEATLARITSIRDDVRDYYAAQERRAQAQHEQENQPHAIGA